MKNLRICHYFLFLVQPCYVCNTGNVGGAHKCCECDNNVHVFCGTAVSDSDEGYGQPVICFKCKPKESKNVCDIYQRFLQILYLESCKPSLLSRHLTQCFEFYFRFY